MTPSASTTSNCPVLFVTQAKSIQSYILASDKLKDMVGATEMVERLPGEFLGEVLKKMDVKVGWDYKVLTSAAGATRIRFENREHAEQLALVWPMVCNHLAPGLEVVQTLQPLSGDYLGAIKAAEVALSLARGRKTPPLPVAGPAVARAQRTGRAAVDNAEDGERIDASTLAKRKLRDEVTHKSVPEIFKNLGLGEDSFAIPDDFNQITGRDKDYLAVIHADGNGLGQLFISLQKHFSQKAGHEGYSGENIEKFYIDLSSAIAEVSLDAAKLAILEATKEDLGDGEEQGRPASKGKPYWPMMPIVLAGDDLTIVFRSDLALKFTRLYLGNFTAMSRDALTRIRKDHPALGLDESILPESLSAGAGIAYVKPGFPYAAAYELSESLAKYAKKSAKARSENKTASPAICFFRVTASTTSTDFERLLKIELQGAKGLKLTMCPYFLDAEQPSLQDLENLVEALNAFPKGPPRELFSLLQTDLGRAKKHFDRMLSVNPKFAGALKSAFKTLLGDSTCFKEEEPRRTPLGDALLLLGMERKHGKKIK